MYCISRHFISLPLHSVLKPSRAKLKRMTHSGWPTGLFMASSASSSRSLTSSSSGSPFTMLARYADLLVWRVFLYGWYLVLFTLLFSLFSSSVSSQQLTKVSLHWNHSHVALNHMRIDAFGPLDIVAFQQRTLVDTSCNSNIRKMCVCCVLTPLTL